MTVRISRWGNSFGVRIPKAALEDAHLQEGDRVEVVSRDGQLVIVKAKSRTLEELVSEMTVENSHPETEWPQTGNEVW